MLAEAILIPVPVFAKAKTAPIFDDEEPTLVEEPIPMALLQEMPREKSGPVISRTRTETLPFPWSPCAPAVVVK